MASSSTTCSTTSRLLLAWRYHLQKASQPQRQPVWSLSTILDLLDSQKLSCVDLVRHCHATAVAGESIWKLRAFDRLESWAHIEPQAQAADERRRSGQSLSLLDGIPLSIKANIAVAHQPLTAGSGILGHGTYTSDSHPVGYHADVTQLLVEECGAICIGITNMDEFGMGSLGTHTAKVLSWDGTNIDCGSLPPTKNPLAFVPSSFSTGSDESSSSSSSSLDALLEILQQDSQTIHQAHSALLLAQQEHEPNFDHSYFAAGGSSCGAAASVAHGSSLVALASDTGGSIRLPAAWCQIVGVKPSYGRISRHGLVAYASSLDTVGFLTPSAACASKVMQAIGQRQQATAGQHSRDSNYYSYSTPNLPYYDKSTMKNTKDDNADDNDNLPLRGIKIGIPSAFVVQECPTQVRELWAHGASLLQKAGATVVTLGDTVIAPRVIQQSLAAYYVLASAEASSNLSRYDGFRYGYRATINNGGGGALSSSTIDDDDDEEGQEAQFSDLLKQQYAATRTQGFGQEVIRRILCGTAVLSSDKFHTHYEAAAKIRAVVTQQLQDALRDQVDYLLIPSTLSPPPRIHSKWSSMEDGTKDNVLDSTQMFANDIMTVPISLAGLAAVNVTLSPSSSSQQHQQSPLEAVTGLQLVGRRLEEERLLEVAQFLDGSSC